MSDQKIKIEDLLKGDRVDLEGDQYAAKGDFADHYEFEYVVVDELEVESSNCTVVHFETTPSVGFPPQHEVKIAKRDLVVNVWQAGKDDKWYWDDSEDHGGLDRISPAGPFDSDLDAFINVSKTFPDLSVAYDVGSAPFHYCDHPDGPQYVAKGDSSAEANWNTIYGNKP